MGQVLSVQEAEGVLQCPCWLGAPRWAEGASGAESCVFLCLYPTLHLQGGTVLGSQAHQPRMQLGVTLDVPGTVGLPFPEGSHQVVLAPMGTEEEELQTERAAAL